MKENENNVVIVKPVVRKRPWVNTEVYSKNKVLNAGTVIQVYIDNNGVHSGLTKEEQIRLESELGYEPGTLDPVVTNDYWFNEVSIRLKDEPNIFYKNNAKDRLKISILKAHPLIANSEAEATLDTEFYITDSEDANRRNAIKAETKEEAVILFSKLTSERKRDVLKLYGKGGADIIDSVVKSTLFEELERDPSEFLAKAKLDAEVINTRALVFDLVDYGILRMKANHYFDVDSDMGDITDITHYLMDPSKQSVLDAYKERLNYERRK